jgi:hypothetical protein
VIWEYFKVKSIEFKKANNWTIELF